MMTFTITLGTTPINLFLLLTGTAYTSASVTGSRRMGTPCGRLVRELIIMADDANTGTVYGSGLSTVSSSDYGYRMGASVEHRMIGNGDAMSVPLDQWLVASASGQKIHVKFNY